MENQDTKSYLIITSNLDALLVPSLVEEFNIHLVFFLNEYVYKTNHSLLSNVPCTLNASDLRDVEEDNIYKISWLDDINPIITKGKEVYSWNQYVDNKIKTMVTYEYRNVTFGHLRLVVNYKTLITKLNELGIFKFKDYLEDKKCSYYRINLDLDRFYPNYDPIESFINRCGLSRIDSIVYDDYSNGLDLDLSKLNKIYKHENEEIKYIY